MEFDSWAKTAPRWAHSPGCLDYWQQGGHCWRFGFGWAELVLNSAFWLSNGQSFPTTLLHNPMHTIVFEGIGVHKLLPSVNQPLPLHRHVGLLLHKFLKIGNRDLANSGCTSGATSNSKTSLLSSLTFTIKGPLWLAWPPSLCTGSAYISHVYQYNRMRVVIQISQNNTSRVVWKEAPTSLTTPIFETLFLMELGGV